MDKKITSTNNLLERREFLRLLFLSGLALASMVKSPLLYTAFATPGDTIRITKEMGNIFPNWPSNYPKLFLGTNDRNANLDNFLAGNLEILKTRIQVLKAIFDILASDSSRFATILPNMNLCVLIENFEADSDPSEMTHVAITGNWGPYQLETNPISAYPLDLLTNKSFYFLLIAIHETVHVKDILDNWSQQIYYMKDVMAMFMEVKAYLYTPLIMQELETMQPGTILHKKLMQYIAKDVLNSHERKNYHKNEAYAESLTIAGFLFCFGLQSLFSPFNTGKSFTEVLEKSMDILYQNVSAGMNYNSLWGGSKDGFYFTDILMFTYQKVFAGQITLMPNATIEEIFARGIKRYISMLRANYPEMLDMIPTFNEKDVIDLKADYPNSSENYILVNITNEEGQFIAKTKMLVCYIDKEPLQVITVNFGDKLESGIAVIFPAPETPGIIKFQRRR